jgi:hypothetical protein
MEVKVDIKPYKCDIDTLRLNHWLQQLEFYFSVQHIEEAQNIYFAIMKLEGHSLTWWEIDTKTLKLEGDPLVTKWEDFKILSNSQLYPIGYVEDQWIRWNCFRKRRAKCARVHHQI